MRRVAWELRGLLGYTGTAGIAGLLCALAALAVYVVGIAPAAQEIEAESRKLAELQSRVRQAQRGGTAGPQTTAERLAAFYGFFPPLEALPEWLDKVYEAAAGQSVVLEKGEYSLTRERDGKLLRYQLVLPVRAPYPKVRAFLDSVLQEVPAAVLESVTLQRENIAAAQVDAQLRFTLVLGGGS